MPPLRPRPNSSWRVIWITPWYKTRTQITRPCLLSIGSGSQALGPHRCLCSRPAGHRRYTASSGSVVSAMQGANVNRYMCDHSVMCQGFIIFILYSLAHCPDIHPDMLQTLEFQNDSATRSEKTSIHAPFAGTYSAADTAGPDLLCWDRDIRPDQGEL